MPKDDAEVAVVPNFWAERILLRKAALGTQPIIFLTDVRSQSRLARGRWFARWNFSEQGNASAGLIFWETFSCQAGSMWDCGALA